MCNQQRPRPACAYAQTDQSLCQPLEYSMTVVLLTEHHLEFVSLKGVYTGSSESTLVKMPHCWKSHVPFYIYNSVNPSTVFTCTILPHTGNTHSAYTFTSLHMGVVTFACYMNENHLNTFIAPTLQLPKGF